MKNAIKNFEGIATSHNACDKVCDIKNDGSCIIFNVDMINDFIFTGPMANPLAEPLVPKVYDLISTFSPDGRNVAFVREYHTSDSMEFKYFPPHGVSETVGSLLAGNLSELKHEAVFYKNNTNGFHLKVLRQYIADNEDVSKVVVVGVCTDICVFQLALSLKTYANQVNRDLDVIIPMELTETYDAPYHNRDLFYHMALEMLSQAGCTIVKNVNVVK